MQQEEKYLNDWRLMFDKEDFDRIIGENVDEMFSHPMDRWGISSFENTERRYYESELVGRVWSDMLCRCQDDSVPVTDFDTVRLYDMLKERGFSQKTLSRNSKRISLKLTNAVYYFDNKVNSNCVVAHNICSICGTGSRVTTLHEEGFIDFMLLFDSVIPEIIRGMDEKYREVTALYRKEKRRQKKIIQMVEIAARSRGIDYHVEFQDGRVELKFERIVFTRVEETVGEEDLADYLKSLPELMNNTVPKVTAGKRIGIELVPVSFSAPQPRDSVYKSLVNGTNDDIIKQ